MCYAVGGYALRKKTRLRAAWVMDESVSGHTHDCFDHRGSISLPHLRPIEMEQLEDHLHIQDTVKDLQDIAKT